MAEQAATAADQAAFGVGTANTRDALEIVAARRKPLAQLLDALKAIPAVGCGVLLFVVLAEVGEVSLEYGMELVAPTGNVLIPIRGRKRDGRAHIIVYERNQLFASDRELVHRSPHNVSHSPDAFSSLRSCEGAGDAVVLHRRIDGGCQRGYYLSMTTVEKMRNEVMALSASERASLAHELILSLDDPNEYDLSPAQETEIQRRLSMVREGTASGRPAAEVFADIRAKYS
jgi:putative addiction module component (TIGR02574 family)